MYQAGIFSNLCVSSMKPDSNYIRTAKCSVKTGMTLEYLCTAVGGTITSMYQFGIFANHFVKSLETDCKLQSYSNRYMLGKDRNDPRIPPYSGQGPEVTIPSMYQAEIFSNLFVCSLATDCNHIRTVTCSTKTETTLKYLRTAVKGQEVTIPSMYQAEIFSNLFVWSLATDCNHSWTVS
jgi:hypothetical protein